MKFWKNHTKLRVILILTCFIVGVAFVISGWRMTGQLGGLGWMLAGILCLLIALWIYNKPFQNKKIRKL